MSSVAVPTSVSRERVTRLGCALRRSLWRLVFALTGGITVAGELPRGGCVVVANHASHADAAALLAALPARSKAVVAAAADYWFGSRPRAWFARHLVGAFGVSRHRGGFAQLQETLPLLRSGGAVVVFPEGTRSRDGQLGEFRSGAERLAAAAGVPLVPVTLRGTSDMLPVHGTFRRRPLGVRIGAPVTTSDAARAAIAGELDGPLPRPDSALRRRVAGFAGSRTAVLAVSGWAVAEAFSWPLVPELLLAVLVVAAPRRGLVLGLAAAAASVAGGVLACQLAAVGVTAPQPLVTQPMRAAAQQEVAREGAAAMRHQPFAGVPYKVYAAEAGRAEVDPVAFAAWSAATRGSRIVGIGLVLALSAWLAHRLRRFYPLYLVVLVLGFGSGLVRVVASWQ